MKLISRATEAFNHYQQSEHIPAFCYAVIKKYNEDSAGYQAVLLTYYGFLALFPLLLVLTTLTDTALAQHTHLQATILRSVTNYFPLLGNQIAVHIHGLKRSGLCARFRYLFTLYGARGVANAFSRSVQYVWHIPPSEQFKLSQVHI